MSKMNQNGLERKSESWETDRPKIKKNRFFITEQEYTIQMNSISVLPKIDSPRALQNDREYDFLMGLSFNPDENEGSEFIFEHDFV